jgi:peptide deformylase
MAVRETTQIGDKRLRAKNARVKDVNDSKVKQVIIDLIDSMHAAELIGMAAPQIGENWRIFVTEPRKTVFRSGVGDRLRVYINPRIIKVSRETAVMYEGCGSVEAAGVFGPVERPKVVIVEALDEGGRTFRLKADGVLGRVIQHEMDHLEGIEFIDTMGKEVLVDRETYVTTIRNSPAQLAGAEISVCEVEEV